MSEQPTEAIVSPRRSKSPVWLAAGVAVGLILAPAAAVAASVGMTTLVGPNGTKAAVAKTGQVLTSNADVNLVRMSTNQFNLTGGGTSSGCFSVYTVPHGYSFILTQISVDTWSDSTPGSSNNVAFYSGTKSAKCGPEIADVNPPSVGETVVPFAPGFVVPAGGDVGAIAFGNVSEEVYLMGYLVPTADAPKVTPAGSTNFIAPVGNHGQH